MKNRERFWSFSWHEVGVYDIPASIDYILAETGQTKLQYIGHSQGGTSILVMASERPEYNDKIEIIHALAPAAFMSNCKSPPLRAIAPFVSSPIFTVISILNAKLFPFLFDIRFDLIFRKQKS